jgi:hypothetical protein
LAGAAFFAAGFAFFKSFWAIFFAGTPRTLCLFTRARHLATPVESGHRPLMV